MKYPISPARCAVFIGVALSLGTLLGTALADGQSLASRLRGVAGLQVQPNQAFQTQYKNTECVKLSSNDGKRYLGTVCRSRNREFAADMGIDKVSPAAAPNSAAAGQVGEAPSFTVSTATSQYPMQRLSGPAQPVFAAVVDCAVDPQPVYRPTGDCSVSISDMSAPEFIYANVLKFDLVRKRKGLTDADVVAIWRRLGPR